MDKIIVIGGEGTAINIVEALNDSIINYNYNAEFLGLANDNIEQQEIKGVNIFTKIKDIEKYYSYKDVKFIYALYKPNMMAERTLFLKSLNLPIRSQINFIHPLSYVSKSLKLGIGNVILANTTIQNNVKIGSNNIINSNVVIEHDTILGNSNFVAAAVVLGAKINVRDSCFIGLNSTIRENLNIDEKSFIGMNSLLLNDTSENEIWYGIPARKK